MNTLGSVVITGGAGLLGTELAHRLLEQGERVRIVDDLSSPAAEANLTWLHRRHRGRLEFLPGDICSEWVSREALRNASAVYQLATTPPGQARPDGPDVHLVGLRSVLGAARARAVPVFVASTVEVLGCQPQMQLDERALRVEPRDRSLWGGLDERTVPAPESAWAAARWTAEQHAVAHARDQGVPVTVLRFGELLGLPRAACASGGRMHRVIEAAQSSGEVILEGDGRRVHDLLFIDDAVKALLVARRKLGALVGGLFHVGGGPRSGLSERELFHTIEAEFGLLRVREGDDLRSLPRWCVLDARRFQAATGWAPQVSTSVALARFYQSGRPARRPVRTRLEPMEASSR